MNSKNPAIDLQRKSQKVRVEHVVIGGDAPVVVQSMTDTHTGDIDATSSQILALVKAGSELVRITVNNEEAARAVPIIKEQLLKAGFNVPLIGDFHFNGHKLLQKYPECAKALSKFRINPGNVGRGQKHDTNFATLIELACKHEKPIRIGVNWGSLDQQLLAQMMDKNAKQSLPLSSKTVLREAMIESALSSAANAEQIGLPADKIIISCKCSQVQELIATYQELAQRCRYALHLGLTEAGMGSKGIVASTAAIAVLLQQGIGDTIRVSLTPEPNGDRCQEIRVAQQIVQALGLRAFIPDVTVCPGCGRTSSDYFQRLAQQVQDYISEKMPQWQIDYPGVEELNVAVMGCVVNGPGESKHANIGISLPGAGEQPAAPVYVDGEKTLTLKGEDIAGQFTQLLEQYVKDNYGS